MSRPTAVIARLAAPLAFGAVGFSGIGLLLLGCSSTTTDQDIAALDAALSRQVFAPDWHRGPAVSPKKSGPARFTKAIFETYDVQRAMELVTFVDGYYRAPGNEGYEAVLDRLASELRKAGFGQDERLQLRFFEQPMDGPAWTPRSAEIALHAGGKRTVLHAFSKPGDVDRCILPINAPSCDLRGPVVTSLDEIEEGTVLVTEAPLAQVLKRASGRNVAAIVSASLETFNVDPSEQQRHKDAVQFRSAPADIGIPVFQISPRSFERITTAAERGRVELELRASVEWSERPLRALCATVIGDEHPETSVVTVSHVQEPGACDNASGVAGLCESALALVEALKAGELFWPARSLSFVWGDEFVQSEMWLEHSGRTALAGLSSDMTGESFERTGAIALLERQPDPGALRPLEPDEHTPWGAGEVEAKDLSPSGLAVIARCAMLDVGKLAGGWRTADHPWEGGSDHDVFAARGIPAVLFWHFTDYGYHTSLDRLDMVDGEEMRRTATAILSTALAVADAEPADLERYLDSLQYEQNLRIAKAEEVQDAALAGHWKSWCTGARHWLRGLCLGLDPDELDLATSEGESVSEGEVESRDDGR